MSYFFNTALILLFSTWRVRACASTIPRLSHPDPLWWYAVKINYCKNKQLLFKGIWFRGLPQLREIFSLLKTHPIKITILCIKLENSDTSTVRIGTIFKTFSKVSKKIFFNIFHKNYEKKNNLLVPRSDIPLSDGKIPLL